MVKQDMSIAVYLYADRDVISPVREPYSTLISFSCSQGRPDRLRIICDAVTDRAIFLDIDK